MGGVSGVVGALALWETDPTRDSKAEAGLAGTSAPPPIAQGLGRNSVLGPGTSVRRTAGGQVRSVTGHPRAWARLWSRVPAGSAVKTKELTPLPVTGAGVLETRVLPPLSAASANVPGCRVSVKGPFWPRSWGLGDQGREKGVCPLDLGTVFRTLWESPIPQDRGSGCILFWVLALGAPTTPGGGSHLPVQVWQGGMWGERMWVRWPSLPVSLA